MPEDTLELPKRPSRQFNKELVRVTSDPIPVIELFTSANELGVLAPKPASEPWVALFKNGEMLGIMRSDIVNYDGQLAIQMPPLIRN